MLTNKQGILITFMFCFTFLALMSACGGGNVSRGEQLYTSYCANCHMTNGQGVGTLYPPLAQSDYLTNNIENLACIIKNGMKGEIMVNGKQYNQVMPANAKLSAQDIQYISNYILTAWGNKHRELFLQEVELQLKNCDE